MDIQILVRNKVARAPRGTTIVCGNSDYTLTFTFDSEWSNEPNKVARFTYRKNDSVYYKDVALTGNTVAVPVLSGIRMISVGVYAGELYTTTPAMIPCAPSILCVSATHDKADDMAWPSLEQRVAILEQEGVGMPGEKGDPGPAGTDGKDGFSPITTIEAVENGTKVTITDAEGTKTFEVRNGEDGEPGQPGPKYELTEEDKQEIAGLVLAALPTWTGGAY